MIRRLKSIVFQLWGKESEAVVVTFASGDPALAQAMYKEVRALVPERRHFLVEPRAGTALQIYRELRREFRRLRIGLAPVLFTGEPSPLRLAAFLLAPTKILAYNDRLERHHLKLRAAIASWLFWRGVPLDRIFLRPRWLFPWKRDRTRPSTRYRVLEGRATSPSRPRVAVLTPYFPYPLSHGGAVRIFHLLREAARDFDICLFSFGEEVEPEHAAPVLALVAKAVVMEKPRYREPRWASLAPPEVREFESPVLRNLIDQTRRDFGFSLLQVEYTFLASYGGDILVEHDVTFDLYGQILARSRTFGNWWNWRRWKRYETGAARRFRRVIVMSEKDRGLLGLATARTIGNGVDLGRFHPEPERPGQRLLFIGSFRHFPNVQAYRFFVEEVWPRLRDRFGSMSVTVVAGPDPLVYWRDHTGTPEPPADPRIQMLGFVSDVRPLYIEANVAIVPTLVSAGTNLKVLEAMAMERAIVSTPSGCEGIGLEHGKSAWVAADAAGFAEGIAAVVENHNLRARLARAGCYLAEQRYGWDRLGLRQRAIWRDLLPSDVRVRPAQATDVAGVNHIQSFSPEAAQWDASGYLTYDFRLAEAGGEIVGFVVSRDVGGGELEILNLAVRPDRRRQGIAVRLLDSVAASGAYAIFLEVRISNTPARTLYRKYGFKDAGLRRDYYDSPPEDAIVMRM